MSIGEYFMSVVVASLIAAIIGIVYPDEKSGVKVTLEYCISLFLLCVIIAPIGSMIANAKESTSEHALDFELPDIDISVDSAVFASLAETAEKEIGEKLRRLICNEIEANADDISVVAEVNTDGGNVIIEKVTVWLYNKAMWSNPREILSVVSEYTDAECIIVNGG